MNVVLLSFLLVFFVLPLNCAADGLTEAELEKALAYTNAGMTFEDALQTVQLDQVENTRAREIRRPAQDMDKATRALIEQIQLTDQRDAAVFRSTHYIPGSIFEQIQNHRDVATHRETLAPLVSFLQNIKQDSNVHVIDGHVAANIAKLPIIGNAFGVDNPNLSIVAIQTYLNQFMVTYTGYEGQAVSNAQLQGYITNALNTASRDQTTLGLYSRITSILQRLENEIREEDFHAHIKHLFDAIAENYITRGGCFEGVRNRAYIRYISTLNILME